MRALASIVLLILGGCATTELAAVKDPDFNGKSYAKILVMAPFSDLESRSVAEKALAGGLARRGASPVESIDALPPTRQYSADEVAKILKGSNVDGVLYLSVTDVQTSRSYVPETGSSTYGQVAVAGNTAWYSGTTYNYGGYYVSDTSVRFKLSLIDAATGKTAWVSTATTAGKTHWGLARFFASLAASAADRLDADGLLARRPQTPDAARRTAGTDGEHR